MFTFEFNPVEEFLGVTPTSKNITQKQNKTKVILNTLPCLGVAEENQQDLVIYGGYLEL